MIGFLQIVGEETQVEVGELTLSHNDTYLFIIPRGDSFEIIEIPKKADTDKQDET